MSLPAGSARALLAYLRRTGPLRRGLDLLTVALLAALVVAGVVTTGQAERLLDWLERDPLQAELLESVETNLAVRKVLETSRERSGAARGVLMRYHDGLSLIGGGHAYFASATHAANGPSYAPILAKLQRVPLQDMDGIADSLSGRCGASATTIGAGASDGFAALADGRGARLIARCPVMDPAGRPVGHVALSLYRETDPAELPAVLQAAELAAQRVAALLWPDGR